MKTTHIGQYVMSQFTKTLLVAGIILVAGVSVGTSAFTTAQVDRQANVDVVADEAGLLGLTDGTSGELVFQNGDGQLGIDFTAGTAGGANTNALFELGNPDDPTTSQAFIITNNDVEDHVIETEYRANTTDATTEDNLKFDVYDGSGALVDTISASGATASWTATANTDYYVVITVDTGHSSDLLGPDTDLSGTLGFSIDDTVEGGA